MRSNIRSFDLVLESDEEDGNFQIVQFGIYKKIR